jgi:hypothetical protein
MPLARHPSRSLEIASLLAKCLGGTLLCLGAIGAALLIGDIDRLGPHAISINVAALTLVLVVPGVLYFVFAKAMARRRRRWALVATLVFAALHVVAFALFPLLVVATGGGVPPFVLILIGGVLLLASFLIVYCVRGLPATRPPSDHPARRGFEPLPTAGAQAPPSPATSFPMPPSSLKKRPPPPPREF